MLRTSLVIIVQLLTLTLLQAQPVDRHYKGNLPQNIEVRSLLNIPKDTLEVLRLLEKSKEVARQSSQYKDLVQAYTQLAYWSENPENRLVYIDSALVVAQQTADNKIIGNVFFDKGELYQLENNWTKTLESYLQAYDYSHTTTDEYLKHKVKYGIASVKLLLKDYEESLEMLSECANFFKKHPHENARKYYLKSLHLTGLCYNQLGDFDKCTAINTKGITTTKTLLFDELEVFFVYSEAVNLYDQAQYNESITYLHQALALEKTYKNENIQLSAYVLLGKNHLQLAQYQQTSNYFLKADSLSIATLTVLPDLNEGYTYLANKTKEEGKFDEKLYYLNKIINNNSLLDKQYKQLSNKVYKEYDNKKLLLSIQESEKSLAEQHKIQHYVEWIASIIIGISILLISFVSYKNQQLRRKNRASMPLLNALSVVYSAGNPQKNTAETNKIVVNEKVTNHILQQLERFEFNKDYLKKSITLTYLATKFKTNPKYISSVIKSHKHKGFTQYINDCRFDYLDKHMIEKKYYLYNIKALANELGFASAKGFNVAFCKSKGIKYSDYIRNLKV